MQKKVEKKLVKHGGGGKKRGRVFQIEVKKIAGERKRWKRSEGTCT